MIRISHILCVVAAALSLGSLATVAHADGRDYNDGPVQNVTFIRTVDGHFDEYMHYLATTFKKEQEAAKAAGLITRYDVLVGQPHNPQDPDIILVIEYMGRSGSPGQQVRPDQLVAATGLPDGAFD